LNDVDLDPAGNAYLTDWTGNRIYRVDRRGRPSVLIASKKLEGPNGILVEGGFLTIAAWGTNIQSSAPWGTDEPGRLLRVDIARRTIKPLGKGERIAGLDGIERDGNAYLATDWSGGRVLRIALDGSFTTVMQLPPSAADLGFDRSSRTIGVPVILASAVVFESV
jgi:sugar lactone lactonase YvrE